MTDDPTLRGIETLRQHVEHVSQIGLAVVERSVVDRESEDVGLHAALLGLLGWSVAEGLVVERALTSPAPQGIAPNVRALLESLVTVRYLTDASADEAKLQDRLSRFYRGVRAEQVKLRNALEDYAVLKKVFLTDVALADRERTEFKAHEAALPKEQQLGKGHWSGLANGLKSVAEAVGLGSDYAVQYRLHSGSTHGTRPWDAAKFDEGGVLITSKLAENRDVGISLAFDALRYLAWSLDLSHDSGAVGLYASEQAELANYRQWMESVETLIDRGIVGPTRLMCYRTSLTRVVTAV